MLVDWKGLDWGRRFCEGEIIDSGGWHYSIRYCVRSDGLVQMMNMDHCLFISQGIVLLILSILPLFLLFWEGGHKQEEEDECDWLHSSYLVIYYYNCDDYMIIYGELGSFIVGDHESNHTDLVFSAHIESTSCFKLS